mmetsp:Transcript_17618/g.55108  ORF Transcript_17618/g.55108 Transcript_17618/m.55108 type:complete len:398 (+) Transcript_17618:35-1228(+)
MEDEAPTTKKRERDEESWSKSCKKAKFGLNTVVTRTASRVGPQYQVSPEVVRWSGWRGYEALPRETSSGRRTRGTREPRRFGRVLARLEEKEWSRATRGGEWSEWSLEPVLGNSGRKVRLSKGSNLLGRTRETQLADAKLSRRHCEVAVDEDGVFLTPLYSHSDCISVNDATLRRNGPKRRLERGDIVKLWHGKYAYRLVKPQQSRRSVEQQDVASTPLECVGHSLWTPPKKGDARARRLAVLDRFGEPCGELDILAAVDSGLEPKRSLTPSPTSAQLAALHKVLVKHRKHFKYASLDLECDLADLVDLYYAVFKPRYRHYDKFKDDMDALHRRKATENHERNFVVPDDGNADECHVCKKGGELLCCDHCPRAFHLYCCDLTHVPDGDWTCPVCAPA